MVSRMESGERPSRATSANTDRSTEDAAGWWARAAPAMASPLRLHQAQMSRMSAPGVRAAACSSADRAMAALSCQNAMSPLPPARGPMSESARANASAGSAHPATTSQPNVDGTSPTPIGLNTWTGPRRHRAPAVLVNRSARVLVVMTAPGQSSTQSARAPDLPTAGRGDQQPVGLHRPEDPLAPLGPAEPQRVRGSRDQPGAAGGRSGRGGPGRRAWRRPAGTTGRPARPGWRTPGPGRRRHRVRHRMARARLDAIAQCERLNRQNSAASTRTARASRYRW